jgi:hypothetical protein
MIRILVAALASLTLAGVASAQTAQQERMKSCNAQASKKDMKGDERQAFMSQCLKGGKDMTAQQERMKTCNVQAKGMKGDERKAFMSRCLKGDTAAAGGTSQQQKMKSCNAQAGKRSLKGDERREFMSECLRG